MENNLMDLLTSTERSAHIQYLALECLKSGAQAHGKVILQKRIEKKFNSYAPEIKDAARNVVRNYLLEGLCE